jgi:hypothetical protein
MREADTTCVGRHVVAGAEMAARKSGYRQLHRPFDNDAVVPIGTYGNAVQLVIEGSHKTALVRYGSTPADRPRGKPR